MSAYLNAIDRANFETALGLLKAGFPDRCEVFWRRALTRLMDLRWNDAAGVPVGQLLVSGGEAVGVILTPATMRRRADGAMRRVINLSSWYVAPHHRWRALAMLRSVLGQHDAVYTDLTPTPDVARLLGALGFRSLNAGLLVEPLPLTAVVANGARGRVVDLGDTPSGALDADTRRHLEAHRAIDCIPAALRDETGWCPLLFKAATVKRLPAARLVYCGDNQRLTRNVAAVSRFLLRHGRLVMVRDARDDERATSLSVRRPIGLKFAKLTDEDAWLFANRTDYAGSELSILDL